MCILCEQHNFIQFCQSYTFVIFVQGPSASAYITYVREEVSNALVDHVD